MQIYFENYSKNTAFAEKIVIIGNQKKTQTLSCACVVTNYKLQITNKKLNLSSSRVLLVVGSDLERP